MCWSTRWAITSASRTRTWRRSKRRRSAKLDCRLLRRVSGPALPVARDELELVVEGAGLLVTHANREALPLELGEPVLPRYERETAQPVGALVLVGIERMLA